ncbi:MAG: terminase family protein [Acidobacteria bacterium]|nr:terminase family protein [Acidobacteriota bacterium]
MTDRETNIKAILAAGELKARHARAPLLYYKPTAHQARYHKSCRNNRATLLVAGNRAGKTYAAAAEIVANLLGYAPWEVPGLRIGPDGDYPAREDVPVGHWLRRADGLPMAARRIVMVATGLNLHRGIGLTIWPAVEGFLSPAARRDMEVRRGLYGVPVHVMLPGGSQLIFASGDQDSRQFEGASYDAAFVDEPFKRAHWAALWRSLTDRLGRVSFTLTPYESNAMWVYELFIADDQCPFSVGVVNATIHDNVHLSKQARDEYLGGIANEDEREAREKGSWRFLTHRAFPAFDPGVHIVPSRGVPPGWVRGMAVDPAHRRPFMMVWAAFGPNGEVEPYMEYPPTEHHKMRASTLTVRDYARIIREMEGPHPADFRVLDPRFGVQHARVKGSVMTSVQEDFAEYGLDLDCRIEGTEREETGIQRIRELMRFDRGAAFPLCEPKLRVQEQCKNTILSLRDSNFVPPDQRDPNVLPEKLLEAFKDARDCVRYLVLYPYLPPDTSGDSYITDSTWRHHADREV